MTQFYTDFSEYATGSPPSDWTWEWQGAPSNPFSVVSDGSLEGGAGLEYDPGDDTGSDIASWDGKEGADVELYVKFDTMTNEERIRPHLRVGTLNEEGYFLMQQFGDLHISKHTSGGGQTAVAETSMTEFLEGHYRFRANGTMLKGKAWPSGSSEPGSWDIEATDSEFSMGDTGVLTRWDDVSTIESVGVGTNGDTAPTSPVANPPAAPSNLNATFN